MLAIVSLKILKKSEQVLCKPYFNQILTNWTEQKWKQCSTQRKIRAVLFTFKGHVYRSIATPYGASQVILGSCLAQLLQGNGIVTVQHENQN